MRPPFFADSLVKPNLLQGDPKMYQHYPVLFVLSFAAILEPLSFYFDSIFFGFSYLSRSFSPFLVQACTVCN